MGAPNRSNGVSIHLFRFICLLLVFATGICSFSTSINQSNGEKGIFRKEELKTPPRIRRAVDFAVRRLRLKKPDRRPMKPRSVFIELEDGKKYHESMTTSIKSAKQFEHWAKKCTESYSEALNFYEFYKGTQVRCKQHCNNSNNVHSNESPIDQPAARQWEGRIKEYVCFENCTKTFFHDRSDVISKKIFKEIELGELYFYLHDCYYVMGDLDKAGSVAFKYTSTNPEREKELKERLEDIKGSYKAEKLPQQMFVRYFLKGLEYIKSKNVRVKDHMEKSVEEYIKSEEECRYRCEKPDPTFEYAPDIFSELAHHYKNALRCKQECVDKLGHLSDYVYDYLSYEDIVKGRKGTPLSFLPDVYIEQGEYDKARQAIASYRLLYPEDDVDHWKKKMMEPERHARYIPRPDISRYIERDEAEKKLMVYIEQKEREKRDNAISTNSIEDSYTKGKEAANQQDWKKCTGYIQKAVNDYNFYVESFIFCRQECEQRESKQTHFAPEYLPQFKHEEQIIRQSFCLSKCIDDENKVNRVSDKDLSGYITEGQTIIDFEKLTPYEYLLFCHDKTGNIKSAASSAKAYLSVFPEDEDKIKNYKYLLSRLAEEDIQEKDIENPEYHRVDDYHMEAYKFATESFKDQYWSDSIQYFSESITYYIKSENDCRTKCEMKFYKDRKFHADLTAYTLNYYFFVMECKLWCGKQFGNLDRYGYQLSYDKHYSNPYVQMHTAYKNLEDWSNACSVLLSWKLTFDPDSQADKKRLSSLKKELEKKNVNCDLMSATAEASLYNARHVEQNTYVDLFEKLFYLDARGISNVRKKILDIDSYLPNVPVDHSTPPSLQWSFYFNIYRTRPFGRNLLLNAGTKDNFDHWKVGCRERSKAYTFSKQLAGIENPPLGLQRFDISDNVEYDLEYGTSSFVTSSLYCYKYQDISLSDLGLSASFMDTYKPTISFETSFACRVDADCIAMIGFLVYNEKKEIVRRTVNQFEYSSLPLGESWRKIAKTYRGDESDYPVGASFLRFYHGGMTNERFYGRYGAKFAFNSVELQLQ